MAGFVPAALAGLGVGRILHLISHFLALQLIFGNRPESLMAESARFLWRRPISWLEPAGALAALALWTRFPSSSLLWVYVPFVGLLLILTDLDLRHQWLPDILTLPGIVLGLFLALVFPPLSLTQASLGALGGWAIFQGIRWVYGLLVPQPSSDLPQGMGGGDVKLLALIGAFLGLKSLPFILAVSSLLGGLVGLIFLLRPKSPPPPAFPFGPCLAVAALAFLFLKGP